MDEQKEGEKYTQLNILQEFHFAKTPVIAGNVHSVELIALKPIAENLGLSWSATQQKLKRDKNGSQLSVLAKVIAADGNEREMLCMNATNFQNWLWELTPTEGMNLELWETYKKGLVIYLLENEIIKMRGPASSFDVLKSVVEKYINANEQGKEYTRKAKEYFKEGNALQKVITEKINSVNLDQLKMF